MKKKVKKIVITVVVSLLVLVAILGIGMSLVIGKMVAEGLLYQNEGNDTKQNSIKQLEVWGFDLEGFEKAYYGEDFVLEAADGVKVPGTYYEADDNSKETVILVHGAGGDRVCMAPLAKLYLEQGWNVLTFDQRGHGDNSSDQVSFGYFEARDVECLVDYARQELRAEKVVVHGQSMGGATTGLYATTQHAREYVDAVVLDSPVDSMERMFRGVFSEMEGSEDIPTDYVVVCGDIYLKLFYGLSFADAETIDKMKENQVKTLVIVSEQDDICFPEIVEELYGNIATDEKAMITMASKHIEGAIDYPDAYIQQVMDFVE